MAEPKVFARGPEFTKVDDETERKIPFRTWLTCIFVSAVDVLAFTAILVLFSAQVWNWQNPPRVYGYGWWPPAWRALLIWWPTVVIAMLAGVIFWSIPLQYRYAIEQIVKHPPTYDTLDPREGLWAPWRREYRWDEGDEEPEPEMSVETVDVNVWDRLRGRLGMRSMPSLLNSKAARTFYRAVTSDPPLATFSERGAADCGIDPPTFRKHIRDPLFKRGLAHWKKETHHNQGIIVTDEGMQLLEQRAQSPHPGRRA